MKSGPIYERVAALELRSARILRAHGREAEAVKAERFALRLQLMLEAPKTVERMRELTRAAADPARPQLMLDRALEGGISLLGADFGNIQIFDAASGSLGIAAEQGFSPEFLEYFAVVGDSSSACGRALTQRAQTVIADVTADAAFAPHLDIAAASGFRAVQSTPLVDRSGRFVGMVSTHFRGVHLPTPRDLAIIDWLGEMIATALPAQEAGTSPLGRGTAERHEHSAELQDTTAWLLRRRIETLRTDGADLEAARLQAQADELHSRALWAAARARARRREAAARRAMP